MKNSLCQLVSNLMCFCGLALASCSVSSSQDSSLDSSVVDTAMDNEDSGSSDPDAGFVPDGHFVGDARSHDSDTHAWDADRFPDAEAVTDATVAPDASSCSAGPKPFSGPIGVVGCSNTNQAADGYLQVSSLDLMVNTAAGGQAMKEWEVSTGGPWDNYESQRPPSGYSAVWLNLCQRAKDGLDQSVVDKVVANIRSRDPNAPVIISPLNFYTTEGCRLTNGNEIPNAGATLADATAAKDPLVFRGPDLGPIGGANLADDGCHLSDQGITLVGEQLSIYFDDGVGACN